MLKTLGYVLLGIIGLLIILQFIARPEKIDEAVTQDDIIEQLQVNADISKMLKAACYDCHSNQPKYPWYASVAPISWRIAEHIEAGRSELNFSEWGSYSKRRKDHKLEEILEEVEARHMPLAAYVNMHPEAKEVLTQTHIENLKKWVNSERAKLESDTTSTQP